MSSDHQNYLSVNVLNDRKIVTYRSLSRALNVHCNSAKRILFEFHAKQNSIHKNSVHATYMVYGSKPFRTGPVSVDIHHGDNDDVPMQSSPADEHAMPDSGSENATTRDVVTLVKEENLAEAKADYTLISSIHVYSIEAATIHNLQILSTVTREVFASDEASKAFSTEYPYGTIMCTAVERRAKPATATHSVQITSKKSVQPQAPKSLATATSLKAQSSMSSNASQHAEAVKPTEGSKRSGTLASNKPASSNLMKAFANSRSKSQRSQENDLSENGLPKEKPPEVADTVMESDSAEEDDGLLENKPLSEAAQQAKQAKQTRERQLREMMDDEDTPMTEPVTKRQSPSPTKEQPKEQSPNRAPTARVSTGRRRGRRRIIKKTTTRDADGFLVTREEPAWESFSEEDTPVTSKSAPAASAGKTRKGVAKGSGNIMSFFGKK